MSRMEHRSFKKFIEKIKENEIIDDKDELYLVDKLDGVYAPVFYSIKSYKCLGSLYQVRKYSFEYKNELFQCYREVKLHG